nr:precorrin-6A reductase [uncultured Niameybacter sp.]
MKNVMKYKNIFVLGGTTEGREIVKFLEGHNLSTTVSVVTDYGQELLKAWKDKENITILQQRLDEEGFINLFKEKRFDLVVDASHPYAKEATINCKKACFKLALPYRRIVRKPIEGNCIYFNTVEEIIEYLEETTGNILLTTGSKDLDHYIKLSHFEERIYIRMLPIPKVVQGFIDKGYLMSHFICMQGPFSRKLNEAMLEHIQAKYLVTKDSGELGGTDEKLEAAHKLGVTVLCLRRPIEDAGVTLETFYKELEEVENED